MPSIEGIDGVLFDLGNTLIPFTPRDSMEFVMKWYRSSGMGSLDIPFDLFLKKYREVVREERSRMMKERWETSVEWRSRRMAEKLSDHLPELDLTASSLGSNHSHSFTTSLHLKRSARYVLDILFSSTNEDGDPIKLGLISNAGDPKALRDFLEREDLTNYFQSVVISGEVGLAKPHSEIFLMALKKMDVRPERAVYVGDRYKADFLGSSKVGMKPVYIRQYETAREPPEGIDIEPTITNLLDLIPLLESGALQG